VELDAPDGGAADTAAPPHARLTALTLYIAIVSFLGIGGTVAVLATSSHLEDLRAHTAELGLLAFALILGELRPIPISRGDDTTDNITISTTFAVALVLVGPLGFALAVQAVAVLLDDLRARRSPAKVLFNLGQYELTILASRATYSALSGHKFLGGHEMFVPSQDLFAGLAAGFVFFFVNHMLISAVVALASGRPIWVMLREDLRFQTATSGVLVALGPLAALAAQATPWMLPLLAAPVLAVHHSASTALDREREALHDPLTGLANRQLLREKAERALVHCERDDTGLAVLMIDLDHFKEINDTLGHHIGDELIQEVASRLEASRPEGATVGRLGGDEFAVLLPDLVDPLEAERTADRLLVELGLPYSAGDVRLVVQASIGIALFPEHGGDIHTLLKRADIALYEAKRERASFRVYQPEVDTHTPQRLSLLADLVNAVDEERLRVDFQPKIDLTTGRIVGAEALVRWDHPLRGVVGPDEFIPLAENTGLIAPITWFVVDQALRQCRAWQVAGLEIGVAVNLSARHLSDVGLPERFADSLSHWSVDPTWLTVEITESSLMTDPRRATQVLSALRRTGVQIAIDDYGTGQASLGYLKRLDIDELKIDKSFIIPLVDNEHDAIIVRSTIELAHNLGLRVVGEGVEDQTTLEWLRSAGCEQAQGFHTGRPMSGASLTRLARAQIAVRQEQTLTIPV